MLAPAPLQWQGWHGEDTVRKGDVRGGKSVFAAAFGALLVVQSQLCETHSLQARRIAHSTRSRKGSYLLVSSYNSIQCGQLALHLNKGIFLQ